MRGWLVRFVKPLLMTALQVAIDLHLAKAKKKVRRTDKLDDAQKAMVDALLDNLVKDVVEGVDESV